MAVSNKLKEEKVFKDPVHRYVHVLDEIIWKLIETKEFQRLRRIRQLGTTYLTFHGAEHSRFSHSLGVYEIVRRIIDEEFKGSEYIDEEERVVALCAALLHDVGHGPFSHAFEKVFHLDHEKFTRDIILGDTEIHSVLFSNDSELPQKVADVINKEYENQLVVSLISSQIDADRMDYLLRDAYFTGVSYGQFDIERILRVMRPQRNGVIFKRSGMHAIEDYIMSRYQMYWQVYFHPVSRSAEVILSMIFKRAKDLFSSGYTFQQYPKLFIPLFKAEVDLKSYLKLDEAVVMSYFMAWADETDEILRDLCERFMNRKLFQYIDAPQDKEDQTFQILKKLLEDLRLDSRYYLAKDESSKMPYNEQKSIKTGNAAIHLEGNEGELIALSEVSRIINTFTNEEFDEKIFYPEDLILRKANNNPNVLNLLEELKQRRSK